MERIKYCNILKKDVTKEDCKECKKKEFRTIPIKICKESVLKVKCPKCGEVFE